MPTWARAYCATRPAAAIRTSNSDFCVTEVLGFEPDGEGEHDLLWLEKSGDNTRWVAQQLAKFAGIKVADVGYAGLKDRHALTRQWFSVRRPAGDKADWSGFELENVNVLQVVRHRRKLRQGSHQGNQFRIALRSDVAWSDAQLDNLATIARRGVPNYFGEQRFGRDGGNIATARRLFDGARLSRGARAMALSAARSFLFNHILQQRVLAGTWDRLLRGDVANLDGSASVFACDETDESLATRLRDLDIHPTAVMWGEGAPGSAADVGKLESELAESYLWLTEGLVRNKVEHARRATRLNVRDLCWTQESGVLRLEFFLSRGGYATAVLREIADYVDG